MLTPESLKVKHPNIYVKIKDILSSKDSIFPCLFAIKSFNKNIMKLGVSLNKDNYLQDISLGLKEFTKKIDCNKSELEKTYTTYLHIIEGLKVTDVSDFLINILQLLHAMDDSSWLKNETTDMNVPSFEFCFNGKKWFPVLLSQEHPTEIRRSSSVIIAFQPSETFHYNKTEKTEQFNCMRNAIHKKINTYYSSDTKPFYLTAESEGKNISQFIGFDTKEKRTYPDIASKKCPFNS